MKLIYKGKFDGNPDSIPHGEHQPNAVKFKEFENPKAMAIFANILAVVILALCAVIFVLRSSIRSLNFFGCMATLLSLFPHEILHALCFKNEVYLFTNLKQGMLFVTGPEVMSKARFIFMSLLPNTVFGFIPFLLYLINPELTFLGTFGFICISMGAGDYYNVYNALTQMPKGALTYLYGFNSYWYMP